MLVVGRQAYIWDVEGVGRGNVTLPALIKTYLVLTDTQFYCKVKSFHLDVCYQL